VPLVTSTPVGRPWKPRSVPLRGGGHYSLWRDLSRDEPVGAVAKPKPGDRRSEHTRHLRKWEGDRLGGRKDEGGPTRGASLRSRLLGAEEAALPIAILRRVAAERATRGLDSEALRHADGRGPGNATHVGHCGPRRLDGRKGWTGFFFFPPGTRDEGALGRRRMTELGEDPGSTRQHGGMPPQERGEFGRSEALRGGSSTRRPPAAGCENPSFAEGWGWERADVEPFGRRTRGGRSAIHL